MQDWPNLLPIFPEIFLSLAIMALMMVGVFVRPSRSFTTVYNLSIIAIVLTALFVVRTGQAGVVLGGLLIVDNYGLFVKLLILLSSLAVLLMSKTYIRDHMIDRFEYPILMLFATLGMMVMVSSHNFLTLYLGLELQSLALYVLAAFHRDNVIATESGVKYFVLGAVSSGLLLYGISLVYGFSGTTDFQALGMVLNTDQVIPSGLLIGGIFVIAGLSFKLSAVPFHMWAPDVYQGAPTSVTAFFATAPKVAAVALFTRFLMGPFLPLVEDWQMIIIILSSLSMILGALAALVQTNIKRLLAYSSIGHIGYVLMGLAAGTEEGVESILIYLSIYIVMNIGTFACVLAMREDGKMYEDISDLAGLAHSKPRLAFAMLVFMFSMAGIPPLAGFFGKLFVFAAALDAQLIALVIIGALSSVVSAYYYLRVIKVMYFDEQARSFDAISRKTLSVILGLSTIAVVVLIILIEPLADFAGYAAASLVN